LLIQSNGVFTAELLGEQISSGLQSRWAGISLSGGQRLRLLIFRLLGSQLAHQRNIFCAFVAQFFFIKQPSRNVQLRW
jgi:hypothetical protein